MSLLLTALVAFAASAPADPVDPALLARLSVPQRRMLAPTRELTLAPAALLDQLGLQGHEQIADVGAGPGFFTLRLAGRVPQGRVIATDIDAAALEVLAARAASAHLANVETRTVSSTDPGLAPGSIDLAFMCQVDHYLDDRVAYLSKVKSALRPTGRLVLVNSERYRDADRKAGVEAGLTVVREASPSPGYFLMILGRAGGGP